jgi:hypothetical protein
MPGSIKASDCAFGAFTGAKNLSRISYVCDAYHRFGSAS